MNSSPANGPRATEAFARLDQAILCPRAGPCQPVADPDDGGFLLTRHSHNLESGSLFVPPLRRGGLGGALCEIPSSRSPAPPGPIGVNLARETLERPTKVGSIGRRRCGVRRSVFVAFRSAKGRGVGAGCGPVAGAIRCRRGTRGADALSRSERRRSARAASPAMAAAKLTPMPPGPPSQGRDEGRPPHQMAARLLTSENRHDPRSPT